MAQASTDLEVYPQSRQKPSKLSPMKKLVILLATVLLFNTSCDQSHLQQAQVPVKPGNTESDRVLQAGGKKEKEEEQSDSSPGTVKEASKDAKTEERKNMVPAISATFERRTTPQRAKWLAEICYQKTEGTKFTPLDLAEIALAETGGHKLSSRAVSSKGAMGVWQLMPERAISHGYLPGEMRDDEKCADAAVHELYEKLDMAKGNLSRAKRYYCGAGPAAKAYDRMRKRFRAEILKEMEKQSYQRVAVNYQ